MASIMDELAVMDTPKAKLRSPLTRNLSIRNLVEGRGSETPRFECALYEDEKRLGYLSNDGRGGSNHYSFDSRQLEAWAAQETGEEYDALDLIIERLITEYLLARHARRFAKEGLPFTMYCTDGAEGRFIGLAQRDEAETLATKYGATEYLVSAELPVPSQKEIYDRDCLAQLAKWRKKNDFVRVCCLVKTTDEKMLFFSAESQEKMDERLALQKVEVLGRAAMG